MLLCAALGTWAIYRLLNPWAVSVWDIKQLEKSGPKYYHSDKSASTQYEHVQQACCAIGQNLLDQAILEIRAGCSADPDNPLFDYLEATVAYRKKNLPLALGFINLGNSKGILHGYTTASLPPDRWQWPEISLIAYTGKRIIRDPSADKDALVSALKMGQKLIWREPQDMSSLMLGLELRDCAAKKLMELAQKNGVKLDAKLYRDLLAESRLLYRAIRKQMFVDSLFHEDSRAWIIGKALQDEDRKFRDTAMLLYLEKQAGKADRMREKNLKIKPGDFKL